jgi:hypothetical protein
MVMLLIEDVVMNANDDANGPPIVCRSPLSDDRRTARRLQWMRRRTTAPPRAVRTPRSFSAATMFAKPVTPAACICRTTGSTRGRPIGAHHAHGAPSPAHAVIRRMVKPLISHRAGL